MSRYISEMGSLLSLAKKPRYSSKTIGEALEEAPSIDIVRCRECKYYEADWCYWRDEAITADGFCNYGGREGA